MTGLEIILAASLVLLAVGFVIYISYKDTSSTDLKYKGLSPAPEGGITKLPDISEPVLSFVETVKQNPKRFHLRKIESEENHGKIVDEYYRHTEYFYQLEDKKTSELWDVSVKYGYSMYPQRHYSFPGWLTEDECELIHNTFVGIYRARIDRISQRKLEQKEKKDQKERNRLKEVYCNK